VSVKQQKFNPAKKKQMLRSFWSNLQCNSFKRKLIYLPVKLLS